MERQSTYLVQSQAYSLFAGLVHSSGIVELPDVDQFHALERSYSCVFLLPEVDIFLAFRVFEYFHGAGARGGRDFLFFLKDVSQI